MIGWKRWWLVEALECPTKCFLEESKRGVRVREKKWGRKGTRGVYKTFRTAIRWNFKESPSENTYLSKYDVASHPKVIIFLYILDGLKQ